MRNFPLQSFFQSLRCHAVSEGVYSFCFLLQQINYGGKFMEHNAVRNIGNVTLHKFGLKITKTDI